MAAAAAAAVRLLPGNRERWWLMLHVWSLPPEGVDPEDWPWGVLFARRRKRKPQVIELRWSVADYADDDDI
jgi:hypothetical protein